MKINTDPKIIDEILTRSISEVIPTKNGLRDLLMSGKRIKIYIGTDPTGVSLHLGHATNYMVLEKFRQLGHEVIFLIGDFTARIGDPTDKSDAARKQLTRNDVVKNTKTWIDQVKPIIDVNNKENPVVLLYNHEWLSKLSFEDVINLSSNFTVQQMIERDMFQERIKSGKPLYMHELFYPLMQGYDSVAMDVDVEMCGTDQKFNALAGRTLLKKLKNKEKFVLITTLLENPITKEKMMSKSQGTGVFLDFDAEKMYGAIMALSDENMPQLYTDCTFLDLKEIKQILKSEDKRETKLKLAYEITKIYHGEKNAKNAKEDWITKFTKKEIPKNVDEIKGEGTVMLTLFNSNLFGSNSDVRRLFKEGAIKDLNTDQKVNEKDTPKEGHVYKIGKHKFVKIK